MLLITELMCCHEWEQKKVSESCTARWSAAKVPKWQPSPAAYKKCPLVKITMPFSDTLHIQDTWMMTKSPTSSLNVRGVCRFFLISHIFIWDAGQKRRKQFIEGMNVISLTAHLLNWSGKASWCNGDSTLSDFTLWLFKQRKDFTTGQRAGVSAPSPDSLIGMGSCCLSSQPLSFQMCVLAVGKT